MKPTKLSEMPFITYNGKRGELIFPTDKGCLTKEECAEALNERPKTFYERYRRRADGITVEQLSDRLFRGR